MSTVSASAFTIWRDWMTSVLASTRQQVESAANRHSAMAGASTNNCIFWARTVNGGSESGYFTTMEQAGGAQSGPDVHDLVTFLKQLPADVQTEITTGLRGE